MSAQHPTGSTATDTSKLTDAVERTKVIAGIAKGEGRTFVLLYTEDIVHVLERLRELEAECDELLS